MQQAVLRVKNISKQYRLGEVGTGTLSHDLNRWWHRVRGKEDPYAVLAETNDRSSVGSSEYVWSLKDISFEVKQGDVLGIIGKNGAGKSTLLKILSQVTSPTTGEVNVKGRIASLLEVGTGFHPELTGRENIFLNGAILGMRKGEIRSKLDQIVEFSGVARYLDTPVKRYSSGMMVRLGFAVAAHLDPEILIVDEVLAVGDAEFQKKCLGKMHEVSGEGRTILFVSHNMAAINSLCTSAMLLEKGTIQMTGRTSDVVNYYLKGDYDKTSFGVVPEDYPRKSFHKNALHINSIRLTDVNGEERDIFRYLEPINVSVELEVEKDIPECVVIVSLVHGDQGPVTYSASSDPYNRQKLKVTKGMFNCEARIEQNLLPGNYSVGIAILDPQGYPFENVSNFGFLRIENFSAEKDQYPWVRPLGMVNTSSVIKIKKNEN